MTRADDRTERTPTHFLALDQGGHASRALLFDGAGALVASGERDIRTERSGGDRVEHDPIELVDTLRASAVEALGALERGRSRVRLVAGLATQRSSLVCWDRETGEPLSPVLSWQDRRGSDELDELAPPDSELRVSIYDETGLAVSPHYGASKYRWCLRELPSVAGAREAGRLAMGPLASFLLRSLLEESPFVVDPANASRTQLCNLATGRWSARLLDLFGVPERALPRIQPNRSSFGTLDLGGRRVPLELCTGDQSAALFAFGEPPGGRVSVNAGTGVFLQLLLRDETRVPGLLTAVVHEGRGERFRSVEGSVNGGAAALHAVAGELAIGRDALHDGLDRWAESIDDPPLFLNGVSGLASPFWDPSFPSRFVPARSEDDALHAVVSESPEARLVAVLESIVFLVVENLRAVESAGIAVEEIVLTGGLASSRAFRKRLGRLTGVPLRCPAQREATARGVAWLLGARSLGGPLEESEARVWPESDALNDRFERWRSAVRRALAR